MRHVALLLLRLLLHPFPGSAAGSLQIVFSSTLRVDPLAAGVADVAVAARGGEVDVAHRRREDSALRGSATANRGLVAVGDGRDKLVILAADAAFTFVGRQEVTPRS